MATQLNRFYKTASNAIFRHDGTLDKLVGDQVMGFFGAPIGRDDHAKRAVATAGEIMRESSAAASAERFGIGIGIATGEAFVGNVGGGEVADYTVIGDTVNVAARLQSDEELSDGAAQRKSLYFTMEATKDTTRLKNPNSKTS